MAMKSDFAQKLLHDLRLKKERMAASQSSGTSNTMARDGQRNAGHSYRGTHKTKGPEPVKPNTPNSRRRASGNARVPTNNENSSQLVQYRSGQSSGQGVDLPMAILLALQNSGKHGKGNFSGSNPMLQFLQQIGKKSFDTGKMAGTNSLTKHHSSTSQFPTFSNLHVNEISKGVQNLNHILRACSNGLNIDKYSIEVGKELLKGATDLEESLRMLVNLQEASEYMIKPQRKSRITLLEEEDSDEASNGTTVQQKQLDLPRFSFDKPSRNSHGFVTKTDSNQRLIELTYHARSSSFSNNQNSNSSSEPHRRSSSWSSNFRTPADSEQKSYSNSSQASVEKGRMSSIIAKLMGLEEIPEQAPSQIRQKESGMRNGEGTGLKITYLTTKNIEIKTKKSDRQEAISKKYNPLKQDRYLSETKNNNFSHKAEKHQVIPQLKSVLVIADENLQRKNHERARRIAEGSVSENSAIKLDKQQKSINQSIENQKSFLEKEAVQGSIKHRKLKTPEKSDTKEPVNRDAMQQKLKLKHRSSEDANMLQAEQKQVTAQTENAKSGLTARYQQKSQQNMHQLNMYRKSGIEEEKHHTRKREEQNIRSNYQDASPVRSAATQDGSPMRSKVLLKTMHNAKRLNTRHPPINQAEDTKENFKENNDERPQKEQTDSRHEIKNAGDESSTNVSLNKDHNATKVSINNSSQSGLVPQIQTEKHMMLPLNQKKPVHVLATGKKAEITPKFRGQTPRKINEKVNKRSRTLTNLATPTKHQTGVTQGSRERAGETATETKESEQQSSVSCKEKAESMEESKSEEIVQTPSTNEQEHFENAVTIAPISSQDDECSSLEEALPPNANDSSKDIAHKVQPSSEERSLESLPDSLIGSNERSHPRLQGQKKALISWKQEPLTENEKKLKETLITSPLFLNTAEALFRLNIPVGILHASDQIYQEKATKFTIDCAYEVMNRKGRRQEQVQPCFKVSICNTTVSSLDNLIKQLYKDFEGLKYYGGTEHDDNDDAETLLKMLERDIHNTHPHLNCMWDFGWNEVMFAFDGTNDIIKDIERQVLDELISEITTE
ncbi:hypothetical protein AgCh_014966 [Apium graveolens]